MMGEFLFSEVTNGGKTLKWHNFTSDTVNQQMKCGDVDCEGSECWHNRTE
jgi:hypothetical protein